MTKSKPNEKSNEDLILPEIIRRPDLQNPLQRGLYALLTTCGWLVWLYICVPLFSLAAWAIAFYVFNIQLVQKVSEGWESIRICVVVVAAFVLLQFLWVNYNMFRFSKSGRRKRRRDANREALCVSHKITVEQFDKMQNAKTIRIHHNENGDICRLS